jgi:hypothetical protein
VARIRAHPADGAVGDAGLPGRGRHDLGDPGDTARRGGVRADDDGAAGLERDQNLVDGRRGRVGRGDDCRHHAERLGNLQHLAVVEAGDHAHRLHRADEGVDALRREEVLLNLVGDDAVAGLLDRQAGELLSPGGCGFGHAVDDRVDLRLGKLGELLLRLAGSSGERSRLGHRGQVAVCLSGLGLARHGSRWGTPGCRGRRRRPTVRPRPSVEGARARLRRGDVE